MASICENKKAIIYLIIRTILRCIGGHNDTFTEVRYNGCVSGGFHGLFGPISYYACRNS